MIIDANAWLGHWPFRQLRHNDADGLLRLMDANDIDTAVVANTHGILYKNVQKANEELAAWVAPHRDRLVPFATIDPGYPGWQRNLRLCHDELGMKGLRLYPAYHDYRFTDAPAVELIHAATELRLPLQLPMRVVDVRQRHRLDTERNLTPEELHAAVQAFPSATFIMLNALGLQPATFAAAEQGRRRVVTDLARMTAVLSDSIGSLVREAGAGSVVFGTGIPFNAARPAFLKLDALDARDEDKALIRSGTMRAILGL